jgi:hypothetical protein
MIPLLLHLVIFVVFQYAPQHLATTCHARRNMTSCFKVRAGSAPLPVNLTNSFGRHLHLLSCQHFLHVLAVSILGLSRKPVVAYLP